MMIEDTPHLTTHFLSVLLFGNIIVRCRFLVFSWHIISPHESLEDEAEELKYPRPHLSRLPRRNHDEHQQNAASISGVYAVYATA
jgi:hypothetical protein